MEVDGSVRRLMENFASTWDFMEVYGSVLEVDGSKWK